MKRHFVWLMPGLSLTLTLGCRGGDAQHIPAGKAQVFAVAGDGEAARFEVPQVRMPDAAVDRHINSGIVKVAS